MYKKMLKRFMPYMEANGGAAGGGGEPEPDGGSKGGQGGNMPEIDYDKLSSILDGKLNVTKDSVIKGYLKEQGLTGDELTEAIKAFKDKKKADEPNFDELNQKLSASEKRALKGEMKIAALEMTEELGLTNKEMGYALKLADVSGVIEEGKISEEKLKEAINKVLEDLPQLKAGKKGKEGFKGKVGADTNKEKLDEQEARLRKAMGL